MMEKLLEISSTLMEFFLGNLVSQIIDSIKFLDDNLIK